MKNTFKIICLITVMYFIPKLNWGQNQFQVTQYMIYQPFINPASIATYDKLSGAGVFRTQWTGINGAPTTGALAINAPITKKNLYVGGLLYQDNIGANKNTKLDLQLAYKLSLKKSSLAFALKGGAGYYQADYSDTYLNDAGDPEFQTGSQSQILPNFGFGAMWFNPKYYVGLSIPAFLKNTQKVNVSPTASNEMHMFVNAGYKFKLSDNFDLNTSVFGKIVSGSPLHGDLNAQIMYKNTIGLGINYRSSKEVSGILTWFITDQIGVSYAYDFAFSQLSSLSGGSHEIMVIFTRADKELLQLTTPRF